MKSKVKFSKLSTILTIVSLAVLAVAIYSSYGRDDKFIVLVVITVGLLLAGMFYCPVSVEATSDRLIIHRMLKPKSFTYGSISSVDRCYPSGGGIRMCGSGGFMGYWGWFSDIIIGTYFGYYGDHDNCILIRLKNGRQYVTSCVDPDEMIESINANLK